MLKRMILAGLAVAVLIGCGGPPKEEQEKAKAAKANADKANAAVYAVEAYNAAATLDKDAAELIKKNEFDKAKAKLIEAIKKYDEAAKAAPENMKAMAAEMKTAVENFKKDWEAYGKDKAVAVAVKKLKKDQAKTYTDAKAGIEGMVKDVEGMIDTDPAGAKAKMDEVNAKFADLKNMTAAPKKK